MNALCQTIGHRPRCSCPNCFIGRPDIACQPDPQCGIISTEPPLSGRDPTTTIPAASSSCKNNNYCADSQTCDLRSQQCIDPCLKYGNCEGNKKCVTRRHRPTCVCQSGFAVNENGELMCASDQKECVRDSDCSSDLGCVNFKCIDPCSPIPIASPSSFPSSSLSNRRRFQPVCSADKSCQVRNHKPVCICMKNCSPSVSICLRDSGCTTSQACRNYQCINPCELASCATSSSCMVVDHKAVCQSCPPGYVADARTGCQKGNGT